MLAEQPKQLSGGSEPLFRFALAPSSRRDHVTLLP